MLCSGFRPLTAGPLAVSSVGLCYPGLSSEAKQYLWKSAISPIAAYGCSSVNICAKDLELLDRFQSNHFKRILGLPKRSHHSKLLAALNIKPVSAVVLNGKISLFSRIFKRQSPAPLNAFLLARF